jgi:enoyl-[acyl-carrier protein] reductase II
MKIIVEEGVKIVFTSAGNPAKWTNFLKNKNIIVAHVISNTRFAVKCEEAKVDAIVAEGFEAGGHNGREEITSMTLLPIIRKNTSLPLIAAGGIASGEQMLAAKILGADGFQIGSLFALSEESSAHQSFKQLCIESKEGDTILSLKKLNPVRLLKNTFYQKVNDAENKGASEIELNEILGHGRAKIGIFDGNLEEGELEIGQVAAMIDKIEPVKNIFDNLIMAYNNALKSGITEIINNNY